MKIKFKTLLYIVLVIFLLPYLSGVRSHNIVNADELEMPLAALASEFVESDWNIDKSPTHWLLTGLSASGMSKQDFYVPGTLFDGTNDVQMVLGNLNIFNAATTLVSVRIVEASGTIDLARKFKVQVENENASDAFSSPKVSVSRIVYLDLEGLDTSNITNIKNLFQYAGRLTELKVSSWDTSKITNMEGVFSGLISLKNLDISNWKTSNVINMSKMFNSIREVRNLDISLWDVSKVTDMSFMFYLAVNLQEINLNSWNTGSLTTSDTMFFGTGLKTIDLSNWNTANLTTTHNMFQETKNMVYADLSGWDTQRLTNIRATFDGAINLDKVDLSNWDVSKVTDMSNMFKNTVDLQFIDLTSFNLMSNVNTKDMFLVDSVVTGVMRDKIALMVASTDSKLIDYDYGASNRKQVKGPGKFAGDGQFSNGSVLLYYNSYGYVVPFASERFITAQEYNGFMSRSPIPNAKGFHFEGWDPDFTEKTDPIDISDDDFVYSAQYAINQYRVTLIIWIKLKALMLNTETI